MSHANFAIFVPHAGCTHQCSFCNQVNITGVRQQPNAKTVHALCAQAASCAAEERELAFFGGSFTAIDQCVQKELLEAASSFLQDGSLSGIRISTRPDCIDRAILCFLREHGVHAIELGAQSMNDRVLLQNGRGHTAADIERASKLIREEGFALGLQMMTGLDGASEADDLDTAQKLIALAPQTVRIYPTLVLERTPLAVRWRAGDYCPQTLTQAVSLGGRLLELFEVAGIRVIRVGLHDEPELRDSLLAGPHHPALRELCEQQMLGRRLGRMLASRRPGNYWLRVAPKSVSKITGHGAQILVEWRKIGYNIKIIQDSAMNGMMLHIEEV